MNPKHDPMYFRVMFWLAWHPVFAGMSIIGLLMIGFALGRWTRPG